MLFELRIIKSIEVEMLKVGRFVMSNFRNPLFARNTKTNFK